MTKSGIAKKEYISRINRTFKDFYAEFSRLSDKWSVKNATFYKDELNCILRDARYDDDLNCNDFECVKNEYCEAIDALNYTY